MASYFLGRRRFLIKPRFQLLMVARGFLFLFFYTVILAYFSVKSVTEVIHILPFNCLTPEVKKKIFFLPGEALLLILLITLVFALEIILISHRIAGPAYRLNRVMREMAAGRYPQVVNLRKHDWLKDLAESLTFLGQALDGQRRALLGQVAQVRRALDECTGQLRGGALPSGVQGRLERLKEQVSILEERAAVADSQGTAGTPPADLDSNRLNAGPVPVSCNQG
jgi:methyl-accepting chemotaxis protein